MSHYVDKKTKNLVNGYIRNEQQNLLNKNKKNTFYTISDLIINEILLYYYITEYFHAGDGVKIESINKYNDTITNIKSTSNGVTFYGCYGNIIIQSLSNTIHEWKFKILNHDNVFIFIGIQQHPNDIKLEQDIYKFPSIDGRLNYCLKDSGFRFKNNKRIRHDIDAEHRLNKHRFGKNDIITMTLKLPDSSLSFMVNDQIPTAKFYNIKQSEKIKYKMFVSTSKLNEKIQLLSYKTLNCMPRKDQHKKERKNGVCNKWNISKKFGFITLNDNYEEYNDIFVHCSEILSNNYQALEIGEWIEFDLVIMDDGQRKAINVTGPNGQFVKGTNPHMLL